MKEPVSGISVNGSMYWNDRVWHWTWSGAGTGIDTSTLELRYSTAYVTDYCLYDYSNQPNGTRSGCRKAIISDSEMWYSRSYANSNILGRACTKKRCLCRM